MMVSMVGYSDPVWSVAIGRVSRLCVALCACGPSRVDDDSIGGGGESTSTSAADDAPETRDDVPRETGDSADPCSTDDPDDPIPILWSTALTDGSVGHVATDATGNIYVACGLRDYDPGDLRSRLLSLRPDGTEAWNLELSGRALHVAVTNAGLVFMAGDDAKGDVVMAADTDGNLLWTHRPADEFVRDVRVLARADGSALVIGHCDLTLEACAFQLDADGVESDHNTFAGSDSFRSAALSESGQLALVGYTRDDAGMDRAWVALYNERWALSWKTDGPESSFGYNEVAFGNDGAVVATGSQWDDETESGTAVADRYDASGIAAWHWVSPPFDYVEVLGVAVSPTDRILISGTAAIRPPSGETDGRVWALDLSGTLIASIRYDEATYRFQFTEGLAIDATGYLVTYSWADVDGFGPHAQDGIVRRHCPL